MFGYQIVQFQNESNKVAIELRVEQVWSEIIFVISNRTHAARSFNFGITHMILDQSALHSVQLPLLIFNLFASFKLTIGSCFSVHYRVMEHGGSLESTKET